MLCDEAVGCPDNSDQLCRLLVVRPATFHSGVFEGVFNANALLTISPPEPANDLTDQLTSHLTRQLPSRVDKTFPNLDISATESAKLDPLTG